MAEYLAALLLFGEANSAISTMACFTEFPHPKPFASWGKA